MRKHKSNYLFRSILGRHTEACIGSQSDSPHIFWEAEKRRKPEDLLSLSTNLFIYGPGCASPWLKLDFKQRSSTTQDISLSLSILYIHSTVFLSGLDQTRHTIFLGSKASCSAPLWSYASYVCEAAINNLPKKQRCDRLPSLPNSIKQSSPNPTLCDLPLLQGKKMRKLDRTDFQHPMFPRLDLDRPLGSTVSSWALWWHPRLRAKATDVMKNDETM